MYNAFRDLCERLLRIPPDPQPPPGDEASTRIYRAAVNYYKYRLVVWAVTSCLHLLPPLLAPIIFLVATIVTNDTTSLVWVFVGLLVLAIGVAFSLIHLAIVRLDYEKRWYVVTDRSLRVREGVVGVREMTVTFANIQNISISQGPIQRILRIADLRVDTAGGGGSGGAHGQEMGHNLHVAWFRGIDNAPEVRALIQQRLGQWKDAGLGDHEEYGVAGVPQYDGAASILAALREVQSEARSLRETLTRAG